MTKKIMTMEQIGACRNIGRDEKSGTTTIALVELDALCDTAEKAVELLWKETCQVCWKPYITIPEAIAEEVRGHYYRGGEAWCWGRGECRQYIVSRAHMKMLGNNE